MTRLSWFCVALAAMALSACGQPLREVSHPFYLTYIEDPNAMALFRCPDGPEGGCAIDGLPGPSIFAAGASEEYIVVARYPAEGYYAISADPGVDRSRVEYLYFARVPNETFGWGNNPEQIVGPLNEADFQRAKAELGLPDFSIDLR
jgi:hypothetical protein